MNSVEDAIALSVVSNPAALNLWDTINRESPSEILKRIASLKNIETQHFLRGKYSADPVEAARSIKEGAEKKDIRIVTYWESGYPVILKEISRPPLVLYVRGELFADRAVAIVGTRKSDRKSEHIARQLSTEISSRGYSIVSGIAVGIDREAHLGALEAGMSTIAVMANGIDIQYPHSNRDLYDKIESSHGSALVSEYPPGIVAGKWTFVRRNRIISGLCTATIVVKAARKSGAMITARYALEQNREVFACPGNSFDESYQGCHDLIRNGAGLVSHTGDILDELTYRAGFAIQHGSSNRLGREDDNSPHVLMGNNGPGPIGEKVLDILSRGDNDIDMLFRTIEDEPGRIHEAIMTLELMGKIVRNGNRVERL